MSSGNPVEMFSIFLALYASDLFLPAITHMLFSFNANQILSPSVDCFENTPVVKANFIPLPRCIRMTDGRTLPHVLTLAGEKALAFTLLAALQRLPCHILSNRH